MSAEEITELLEQIAQDIRVRFPKSDAECEILLNLAAVVAHIDPETLRS